MTRIPMLTEEIIGAALGGIPVVVPDADEARASAAAAPLLVSIRQLVEFIGDGRKLTQTDNVTLADARQLVAALGTGDRIDGTVGGQTFRTRSAADLPRLSGIIRLATAARFVRKAKGRLLVTKAGRAVGQDPLADLARLIDAIDDVGMVSTYTAGRLIWASLAPFFDDLFAPLTTYLLTSPHAVPFTELVGHAFEQFESDVQLDNPYWDEPKRHDLVEAELRAAIETLESAGVLTWASELVASPHGTSRRGGGMVALTPAGRWVLVDHLATGHGVPVEPAPPASFTAHGFAELITACERAASGEFERVQQEISAWVAHRGTGAFAELIDAARTATDPPVQGIALAVAADHGGPAVEPAVRSLLDTGARAAALVWLVDQELEPAEALLDPDPAVFVDVLLHTLVGRGPAGLIDVFDHAGDPASLVALLDELRREPSLSVTPVLTALCEHPDPRLAKAARKAAMQHASG
jgi:hypothetical protein